MRNFVDLHTHSWASDGQLSPSELVAAAERRSLAAVALTDHDTIAGLAEAAAAVRGLKLRFIPGIEISAQHAGGTLHIVGLGIDPANREMTAVLQRLLDARSRRNPKMIQKLRDLGMDVSMEELRRVAGAEQKGHGAIVSRVHMAQLLVEKGYARDRADAFDRFLGFGRPGYADKERLAPRRAFQFIHAAGGLAILGHPAQLKCGNAAQFRQVVSDLRQLGLDGIEVYHPDHDELTTRRYLDLARKERLLVSGGSDFHGGPKSDVRLGQPKVPLQAVAPLLARLETR
jgi:hypothetical protein